jgi:hypothetical protein
VENGRPEKRKMRSYTVAALLGIFVVAAILALVSHLLPGGLSRLLTDAMNKGRNRSDAA